jgi:hypothetical protein
VIFMRETQGTGHLPDSLQSPHPAA